MTDTTVSPAGGPGLPGSASDKRRRLISAGAVLALLVALLGAYLIRGGSGATSTAGPVPHGTRSPNSAVPTTRAPARPPAAKPSPAAVVARNPFLPLVAAAPAGATGDATSGTGGSATGTTGTTGASPTPTVTPDPGTTSGTTGSDGGAASPAAPVDGNPNFTG